MAKKTRKTNTKKPTTRTKAKKKATKKKATKKKATKKKATKKKATKKKATKKKATKKKATKKKATKKKATKKKATKKKATKKKATKKKATKKKARTPATTGAHDYGHSGVVRTSGVTRTLEVRERGPKIRRDTIKDGGSRVMMTSKVKGSDTPAKVSGEQPQGAMGKEPQRKSLLGRLV